MLCMYCLPPEKQRENFKNGISCCVGNREDPKLFDECERAERDDALGVEGWHESSEVCSDTPRWMVGRTGFNVVVKVEIRLIGSEQVRLSIQRKGS